MNPEMSRANRRDNSVDLAHALAEENGQMGVSWGGSGCIGRCIPATVRPPLCDEIDHRWAYGVALLRVALNDHPDCAAVWFSLFRKRHAIHHDDTNPAGH